jgi:hypothetical protein
VHRPSRVEERTTGTEDRKTLTVVSTRVRVGSQQGEGGFPPH